MTISAVPTAPRVKQQLFFASCANSLAAQTILSTCSSKACCAFLTLRCRFLSLLTAYRVMIEMLLLDLGFVKTAFDPARKFLAGRIQEAIEGPPAVPQERAIGRPVEVGIDDCRVDPEGGLVCSALRDSVVPQSGVELLPGLRPDSFEALVEECEIHDHARTQPGKVLKERAMGHPDHGFPQRRALDLVDDQSPEDVFRGLRRLSKGA